MTRTIERTFLPALLGYIALMTLAFVGVVALVDPYGVSPIGAFPYKPKRIGIDRMLKPYEVWQKQPKTIFMGTSRVHQSMDPSVLDGTEFAPAYNAAIPASTIRENEENLRKFLTFDPAIKHVVMEVFFYNFQRGDSPFPAPHEGWSWLGRTSASLNFSIDALRASFDTLKANATPHRESEVRPGGYWTPAPSFQSYFPADIYIRNIVEIHRRMPASAPLQDSQFAALDRIVALCREHDVKLTLVILPNYPWDDYRLRSVGYWPTLEEFLRRMSAYDNVVSFSQYNDMTSEPPSQQMQWWYDPIHPGRAYGDLMLKALSGQADPQMPANLMRPITPETVEAVIAERRGGLDEWVVANPDFAAEFDAARDAAISSR